GGRSALAGQAVTNEVVPGRSATCSEYTLDTALVRASQDSLRPRSRLKLGNERFQPHAARRLDFADLPQEFFFVKGLPCPCQDFGRNPLTRERSRLVRLIGSHRSLRRGTLEATAILHRLKVCREGQWAAKAEAAVTTSRHAAS